MRYQGLVKEVLISLKILNSVSKPNIHTKPLLTYSQILILGMTRQLSSYELFPLSPIDFFLISMASLSPSLVIEECITSSADVLQPRGSQTTVPQSHLVKTDCWAPPSEFLIHQVWNLEWGLMMCILTSSQVRLMLLVREPLLQSLKDRY